MAKNPKLLFKEIGRAIMLIASIALSVIPNFVNISDFIKNPNHIIGLGQIIFILIVLWYLYDCNKRYVWEEPDIELFSYPKDFTTPEYYYKTGTLEVKNNEELPITKCFATLEFADDIHINDKDVPFMFNFVPSVKPSQRIKWEEELEMDKGCEITIMGGARKHLSVGSFKNMFFYHLQEGDVQNQKNFGIPIHIVKIRIDGYFNERQMKPLFFDGYIYATNLTPPDDFIAQKGKIKSKTEELGDRIQNLRMVFKSGNWVSDDEIMEYMGIKEYNIAQR